MMEKLGLSAMMAVAMLPMTVLVGLGAAMMGADTGWMVPVLVVECMVAVLVFSGFVVSAMIEIWRDK